MMPESGQAGFLFSVHELKGERIVSLDAVSGLGETMTLGVRLHIDDGSTAHILVRPGAGVNLSLDEVESVDVAGLNLQAIA